MVLQKLHLLHMQHSCFPVTTNIWQDLCLRRLYALKVKMKEKINCRMDVKNILHRTGHDKIHKPIPKSTGKNSTP